MSKLDNVACALGVIASLYYAYLSIEAGFPTCAALMAFVAGCLFMTTLAENKWPRGWWRFDQ
jgi:hypothetical protein